MGQTIVASVFALGLLGGMVVLLEVGRRIGARRLAKDPEGARAGFAAVDGAVFGLMGLLVAFTFSGAAARFDARRHWIVDEANAIGTAWLRLDALPADAQPALRESVRRYLDARLAAYRKLHSSRAAADEFTEAAALRGEIWRQAVAACRTEEGQRVTMLVLPAINAMFDIARTRAVAARTHPPHVIFAMLGMLALASALLAGHGMAGGRARSWIHMLGFAVIVACIVYIILDLEFPRFGFIRIDAFDQVLVDLRASMQ
jgi:hypothetical protein